MTVPGVLVMSSGKNRKDKGVKRLKAVKVQENVDLGVLKRTAVGLGGGET